LGVAAGSRISAGKAIKESPVDSKRSKKSNWAKTRGGALRRNVKKRGLQQLREKVGLYFCPRLREKALANNSKEGAGGSIWGRRR